MQGTVCQHHLERMRCLLTEITNGSAFVYENAMGYEASLGYALSLVPMPDESNLDAWRAYVNFRYHATHPGAVFANDTYTREGVMMAVRALEREVFSQERRRVK